jgi:hypothetical protein
MFSDREVKTTPVREPSRFMARLKAFGKWFLAPPPPPPAVGSADWYWYGGLCADPHSFTEQLVNLQKSLRPADSPVAKEESVESIPVEVLK